MGDGKKIQCSLGFDILPMWYQNALNGKEIRV